MDSFTHGMLVIYLLGIGVVILLGMSVIILRMNSQDKEDHKKIKE